MSSQLQENLIFIGLTTYDRLNLLRESVLSILNQNYKNFILVISNDNPERVLTNEQIKSIHEQLVVAFKDDTDSLVEMILNNWLAEDKDMLWANMDELITQAEKGELLTTDQINNILNEDSYGGND